MGSADAFGEEMGKGCASLDGLGMMIFLAIALLRGCS